ncbi:MAG: radical SAM protein [Desulfosoma sp.]
MIRKPTVLLINPWITDFAAYDLWAKPLGLLLLGALVRESGCRVFFVDCVDRHDPDTVGRQDVVPGRDDAYGTGKYPKMPIPVPEVLADVGRPFFRYGIHPESFRKKLSALPKPDLVCVTSLMTYWYPGVQETIAVIKDVFPKVPVWLGGIYARLCPEHARQRSGADWVFSGPLSHAAKALKNLFGDGFTETPGWDALAQAPPPAVDLMERPAYGPLLLSLGCPYRCPYCASAILQPERVCFSARRIFQNLLDLYEKAGVRDFAFYDDALLLTGGAALRELAKEVRRHGLSVRFHTPNALHVNALADPGWSRLLFESGFVTLRLGLETTRSERHKKWGGKTDVEGFFRAMDALSRAGFSPERIGVYLLAGLPDQNPEEVWEGIEVVKNAGAMPYVAEFSPIPGTAVWPEAVSRSPFPLEEEPLTHNNSFFACRRPNFTLHDLECLKRQARNARRTLKTARGQGSRTQAG